MKIVFVSNYFNHHQKPVSDRLYERLTDINGSYTFVQTEPMDEERIRMGWGEVFQNTPYLVNYEDDPKKNQAIIDDADVVIFGGTDDESYIQNRLRMGKVVWRYSERLYKTGRYKFVSPRGLLKKYLDHTRYNKRRVYLLCSGAYVAGDFRLVHAYPNKKFRYGYFPEFREHDIDALMKHKKNSSKIPRLLWAARMIDWKHPELPVELAAHLKEAGYKFRMVIVGDGVMAAAMKDYAKELGVKDVINFLGSQNPDEVRMLMEKSQIYLTTSDNQEGWGAVINEAMNSGCAVVANKAMGAAPYLLQNGNNGLVYRNGNKKQFFATVKSLLDNPDLCEALGRAAYDTIKTTWNAQVAADRLYECMVREYMGDPIPYYEDGPLSKI